MVPIKKKIKNIYAYINKVLPFRICKNIEVFINHILLKKTDYMYSYFYNKENKDVKFCIFRYSLPDINLLSAGIEYISNYYYAKEKNIIPIMDLEYQWIFENYELGKHNMWDLVFQQKVTVKEAIKNGSVYIDEIGGFKSYSIKVCKDLNGNLSDRRIYTTKDKWKEYYKKIHSYIQECWRLNESVKKICDEFYNNHFNENDCVLGIMLREDFSDEFNKQMCGLDKELYERHPLNPNVDEIIKITKQKMKVWKCNKIFLSTMYYESIEKFYKEFGTCVITIDRNRRPIDISKDDHRISVDLNSKENYNLFINNKTYYEQETLAYIYEVVILSKCEYYIAPHCSGSAAVLAFNGGRYKDIEVLENRRQVKGY